MTWLIQHAIQDVDGLSEDRYVNTFHMIAAPLGGDDFPAAAAAVKGFYEHTEGGGLSIKSYMANHAWGPGCTVKIYDLLDAEPREPVYQEEYDPTPVASASVALPSEVSSCISFTAPPAAGVPPARRRGRIYIGPLNVSAVSSGGATVKSRPATAFQSAAVNAFRWLAEEMPTAGWLLVQYSPTAGVASAISSCWMDDAWDTQRRRGVDPTSRVTEPIA